MKSGRTIRAQLFLLLGLVALPLIAVVAYNLYHDFSQQREIASASGRTLAEITAAETSRFLHDTQTALAVLSQRPRVRALDPRRCDPALSDYLDSHPHFANVLTVDVSGRVICSVAALPAGVSTIPRDIWLDKLKQTEAFTVGKPSRGLITGRRVVVLAHPLRNQRDQITGGIGLPVDLVKIAPLAGKIELPPETSVRIVSGDGTVIASLQNPQAEVGKDARGSEIVDIVLARRQGEARAVDNDGIERLYAFLPVPGVDWYAYAGVPVSVAFAELNRRTLQSAVVGTAIVLLALALALAAARGVIRPVTAIGETARKIQGGDRDARFRPEGPTEIAQVLAQFNRTLDALAEDERRRRDSEGRHSEIIESIAEGIIGVDEQQRIVVFNAAAEQMFGRPAAQIIGQPINTLVPERFRARHEEQVAHFAATGRTGRAMGGYALIHGLRANGEEFPIEATISQSGAAPDKLLTVILRDVTERSRAEQARARLAAVVENSNDAIISRSLDGTIETFNAAAERLLGYSAAEAIGQTLTAILPADRARENTAIWDLIRQGRQVPSMETVRITKDGRRIDVSLSVSPVKDAQGEVVGSASFGRDISERKQAEERIQYLTQYDAVTGLPNRRLFNDRLTLAVARDKRIGAMTALLLLDLDRFKAINETLGHSAGDKVLQAVTARLRERLREVDTVARLGGDEFAVILESVTERAQASRVAGKILDIMAEPYTLEGEELFITASIGVALHPADADSVEKLIECAELAMYRAKADGRNAVQLYVSDQNPRRMAGLGMEAKLRRAIERDELLLNFQPKVDMMTGAITGAEALVRWRNPDLGLVSPADFIPLAEETGLIVPVGEWVLHSACAQASAWHRLGYPITVAVNLSARQFRQNDLCGMIALMLADTGLPAGRLELEITESMIMHRPEQTIATLQALHDMGVTLSVDDFGTGYSSLAYLKRFPVHTLKVDQSFVRDLHQSDDDAAIVRAIIALAKSLNLKTVAEGVETEQQRIFLAGLHCDEYQGYHFSKPLPAAGFMRLLQERGVAAATAVEGSI